MTRVSYRVDNRRAYVRRVLQFSIILLGPLLIGLVIGADSVRAETVDWTVIPRAGGGAGWNDSTPFGPATQSFVNIDGSDVNLSVSYSGNMWDNNSVPNVYGATAPLPVVEFQKALRWTNNTSDTGGAPGAANGPTSITMVFDSPVLLNNFTVISLSRIGEKYEWMQIRAYDVDNNILIADQTLSSTYVPPNGDLETRPDSPHIEEAGPIYLLRGTSPQTACQDDCGYDRLTFEFTSTPIERVEIVHFATNGPSVNDPRSSGLTSVAIEPIIFSIAENEMDLGGCTGHRRRLQLGQLRNDGSRRRSSPCHRRRSNSGIPG